jgi:hypothetical protein
VRQIVRDWVATERGTTVERMRVTRSAYASSATLLNVHLTLAGGERLRVVCKLGDPDAQIPAARGVRPEAIFDAGREAWMYESVLAFDGVADAPRLLSSGRVRDGGRWLLMEWAGSVDLGQVGARAVWCEAASRLARMHVWGESRVDELSRGSLVRWDDPQLHLWWARRARRSQAVDRTRGFVTKDPLGPLWRRYHVVADRVAAMPKTLVHGDLNASNVLVMRASAGNRIRIIDWETAGVGPGLIDLASLISGRLPDGHRAAMEAAYRANLAGSSLSALPADAFDEALCWCRLALAVKWLGWSPGWSPPKTHGHDWRREAVMLARRLGLMDRA